MSISKKKLYIILSVGLLSGYILLFAEAMTHSTGRVAIPDLCFFKTFTGIPCPSCGSTRSVVSLIDGNFTEALRINPLGIVIAVIMLVTPFWITYDLATGKSTLHGIYRRTETILRRPLVATPLILIIIINWVWNIFKGL